MFYCKNMEVEDGINLYYKLKSEYEEEVKKFKRKQKTFPRKKRMLMGKPLCIQCQRPVGSVFSCHFDKNKEERVLKARCGDMTHPCAFRILIHLGDFVSVVSLLSEYEKNIQDLKREIIQEKNNLLFGYIKPEKAVESFTLLKNDFDATLDLYEFTLQHDYREKVENKEKMQEMKALSIEIEKNILEIRDSMKKAATSNEASQDMYVKEAVEVSLHSLAEKTERLRELKYPIEYVYKDSSHVNHLVQTHSFLEKNLSPQEPLVEIFQRGAPKTQKNRRQQTPQTKTQRNRKPLSLLMKKPTRREPDIERETMRNEEPIRIQEEE